MRAEAHVSVNAPMRLVWAIVSDIENAADNVRAIDNVEILERPDSGLVGLTWEETRTIFGKSSSEKMRITSILEGEYLCAEAHSCGSRYDLTTQLSRTSERTHVRRTFEVIPKSVLAKVLLAATGFIFASQQEKALLQDLVDVKKVAESLAKMATAE